MQARSVHCDFQAEKDEHEVSAAPLRISSDQSLPPAPRYTSTLPAITEIYGLKAIGCSMSVDVTVFIPTYNRPQWLLRTIHFLQRGSLRLPIIVGDGSEPLAASENEALCRKAGENIEYFHVPSASDPEGSAKNYLCRFVTALDRVRTPYVVCCADDDLLLPETAVKAASFLSKNPDYVGCQGTYLNFRYKGDDLSDRRKGLRCPVH